MKLNDNHYNLIFGFERIYEFLSNDKFELVSLTITNSYFLTGKFRFGNYFFCFNYCSLDSSIICSYKLNMSSIISKHFSNVSSFIDFLNDAFLNVNRQ